MRPGQPVNTPRGPGVALHPVIPGHPEKAWWVLFGRFAECYELGDLGECEQGDRDDHLDDDPR